MLPHFLLRPVERHELQTVCTARVTAAEVRGNEALDACSGGGVGKAELQVAVRPGENDDDGILAAEPLYELIMR
jgi:hypothetical protein